MSRPGLTLTTQVFCRRNRYQKPGNRDEFVINQQRLYISLDEHGNRMACLSAYRMQLISVIRAEIGVGILMVDR